MKILPVAVALFHMEGQTDGHDEGSSQYSLFERA
jgi:hypothetical protein